MLSHCSMNTYSKILMSIGWSLFIALWIPSIPLFFEWLALAVIIWMLMVSVTSKRGHSSVTNGCGYSYNDSMIYNISFLTVCVAYFFEWIKVIENLKKIIRCGILICIQFFSNISYCINKVLKIIIKNCGYYDTRLLLFNIQ